MSTLNTLANPSAAVVATGIVSYVAHHLGKLKIGSATLAEDVAKDWPVIKAAAEEGRTLAKALPGVSDALTQVQNDVKAVEARVQAQTGIDPAAVAAEVQKQLAAVLAQAAKAPQA